MGTCFQAITKGAFKMITFFTKFLFKNKFKEGQNSRHLYGILSGIIGITLNLLLFTAKLLVGFITKSISITADAFNNLSDAASSIITIIGFKLANQKPDKDHPFGHGRIEYLTGLFVSIAILLMSYELFRSSIKKIIHPESIEYSPIIIPILIASILVKLYMFYYNNKLGKKINSPALKATALDSLSDCVTTSVVLMAQIISLQFSLELDAPAGIFVSIFIFIAGIKAAKDTINPLLGQKADQSIVEQVRSIVLNHPDILDYHDLIIHDYGPDRMMISLHAEVSAQKDLLLLHDSIDNIERDLQKSLNCKAVIHMDPVVTDDPEIDLLRDAVLMIAQKVHPDLTIHDFRIVKGPSHTNLIFDLVIPFNLDKKESEIYQEMIESIAALDPKYHAIIELDRSFY